MKKLILIVGLSSLFFSLGSCKRHKGIENDSYKFPERTEIITSSATDRNDLPMPPSTPWWSIDTSNLNICEEVVWKNLKKIYPIGNDNYWNYNIYGIEDDPGDYQNRTAFDTDLYQFFVDTVSNKMLHHPDYLCDRIDSLFFLDGVGTPTHIVYNQKEPEVTYFYHLKRRMRKGPCADIFDEGSPYENKYNGDHFNYCGHLRAIFDTGSGNLISIYFNPG